MQYAEKVNQYMWSEFVLHSNLINAEQTSILVVEDDAAVASGLVTGLKNVGFAVELATDGEMGTRRALSGEFELVILDLNLPERDGFGVLEALSGRISTPVIVLTARTELETRLKSFSLGAVDYIPKPFWMEELVARIQSRLRLREDEPHRVVSWSNVVIDLDARTVNLDEAPIELTSHEFNVLAYLVERPDRAITRKQLADHALPESGSRYGRTVDSHMCRIRNKLGEQASEHIKTVWGVGYKFLPLEPSS